MDEFTGDNSGLDSSFFRYVKTKIAIELKTSIEQQCVFREEPYKHLPAERKYMNQSIFLTFYEY